MDDALATTQGHDRAQDAEAVGLSKSWRRRAMARLRDRAGWPVVATAVAAIVGMMVAWAFMPVRYTATAQIAPRIDLAALPMHEQLKSRVALPDPSNRALHVVISDKVLAAAADSESPGNVSDASLDDWRDRLTVSQSQDSPVITLGIRATRRSEAGDDLQAVIHALQNIEQSDTIRVATAAVGDASADHARAMADHESVVRSLESLRIAQGQPRAEQRVVFLQTELARIDQQISAINIALAGVGQDATEAGSDKTATLNAALARDDDQFAQLLEERELLDSKLHQMRRTMGRNAPDLIATEKQFVELEKNIADRARALQALRVNVGTAQTQIAIALTPAELAGRREDLKRLRDGTGQALAAALADAQSVREAERAVVIAEGRIAQAQSEVESLLAAGALPLAFSRTDGGTTTITRDATVRNQAVIFSGISFGLLALITSVWFISNDNRLRKASDIRIVDQSIPLLAQLPMLEDSPNSSRLVEQTCLAVHELRGLVEIRMQMRGCDTFAITSPSRGSGKTSLTVALACSLAKSGIRTLLVDFDLLGRVRNAGHGRRSSGGFDPELPNAMDERQNLGQAMIQMGYVDERDADIIVLPKDRKIGVQGFLHDQNLAASLIETSLPQLSILPAIGTGMPDLDLVSLRTVRRLIEQARRDFDLVLFDTGPIPGSVDSLIVASAVDEVITVASRGESQKQFDRMRTHLRMAGARVGGTVFNRALPGDLMLPATGGVTVDGGKEALKRVRFDRAHGSGMMAAAVLDSGVKETSRFEDLEEQIAITEEEMVTIAENIADGATRADVEREMIEDGELEPATMSPESSPESNVTNAAEESGHKALPEPVDVDMEVFAPLLSRNESPNRQTRSVTGGYDGDQEINEALDHIMHSAINAGKKSHDENALASADSGSKRGN